MLVRHPVSCHRPYVACICISCTTHSHTFLERGYPKTLEALAAHVCQPCFPELLRRFLYEEVNGPPPEDAPPIPIDACPIFLGRITVHHSAIARFYAPSDLGGAGGMYREHIRSNPHWHGYARRDTVLVDVGAEAMRGLVVGRVHLFFSFVFADKQFECALINWLVPVGDAPDPDTGMWVVTNAGCRRWQSSMLTPLRAPPISLGSTVQMRFLKISIFRTHWMLLILILSIHTQTTICMNS